MRTMKVDVQPWLTPNFVTGKMPIGKRQDGISFDGPKWSLAEVDADTLAAMCDDFRAEVFRKAGKPDPSVPPQEEQG
jgi:hypothetical protein